MAILGIFKKAGKLKKKMDAGAGKPGQAEAPVDKSIYRIGIYGHKGVGKTVFFAITYAFSKNSPDLELMALGETQELLEEKFNLMRGKGMNLETGEKIGSRRFPPLSTGEQQLNFEARVGRSKIIPLNTIDYSGELIYIDNRGELKQSLIDYFKSCECILFFIDPESIKNEGERSNRIASFTDLIAQLSGPDKRLKVPIGLVVTKADEIPGFKSADQSTLIGRGSGYIRALNFAGFLRGVLKQRSISSRPDWRSESEATLNRLESLFKPLMNRSLDFQIFFISSTGNSPEMITDDNNRVVRVPPEDLRPLGVSQPFRWAFNRISCYRRAAGYMATLKWAVLILALVIDLVAFAHIYNQMKIRSLFWEIGQVSGAPSNINRSIATKYQRYANNFIVRNFFGEYSRAALQQYNYFSSTSTVQQRSEQGIDFKNLIMIVDEKIGALKGLRSDQEKYDAAIAEINTMLARGDSLANEVTAKGEEAQGASMQHEIASRRGKLEEQPTTQEVSAAQELIDEYDKLLADFSDSFQRKDFDYLLGSQPGQFPDKLKALKDKLDSMKDDATVRAYSRRVQNYLTSISTNIQPGILIPFSITGAEGGQSGYSLAFSGASGLPAGHVDTQSAENIRVPVDAPGKYYIELSKGSQGQVLDKYPVEPGYSILKLDGKRISFAETAANITFNFNLNEFYSHFKDKLY